MDRDLAHDLCGCLDGFMLTYLGEEVATFGSFIGATTGLRVARQALQQLDETLAKAGRKDA